MEIIIRGDKMQITDAMKDYINEKLGKLEKYLENSDAVRANVIVKVKNHEQTVEITIPLKSFILRSEETKEDFYAAVDKTIDKLERQVRKNKTKLMAKQNKASYDFNFEKFDFKEEIEDEHKVIKATELLLNIILGRNDMEVTEVAAQREYKNPVMGGRSIKLDIYAKGSDGKV